MTTSTITGRRKGDPQRYVEGKDEISLIIFCIYNYVYIYFKLVMFSLWPLPRGRFGYPQKAIKIILLKMLDPPRCGGSAQIKE